MRKAIMIGMATCAFLTSCGPSAAERELMEIRAKRISDSINAEIQLAEQRREEVKQMIIVLKGELAGAEAKMASIQEFKLLRSADEKAQEVAEQTVVMEQLRGRIAELQSQVE